MEKRSRKLVKVVLAITAAFSFAVTALPAFAALGNDSESSAKSVVIADCEDVGQINVNYPTDGSVTVSAVSSPRYEGAGSLKLKLESQNQWTKITYAVGATVTFPANMEKKYLSFWMNSEVDAFVEIQLCDSNWNGDEYYIVHIERGEHLYNMDISDCAFAGTRGILINNWSDGGKSGNIPAQAPYSGYVYLDSLIVTDTPRSASTETTTTTEATTTTTEATTTTTEATTTTTEATTTTTEAAATTTTESTAVPTTAPTEEAPKSVVIADCEDVGQINVNYPTDGSVTVSAVSSPRYEGAGSLKLKLESQNQWTKITYAVGATVTFPANMEKKYLSFWMNSEVDAFVEIQLCDSNWNGDEYYIVHIERGEHLYNMDISDCAFAGTRGILINNWSDGGKSGNIPAQAPYSGYVYLDSLIVTDTPRGTATNPTTPSTGSTGSTESTQSTQSTATTASTGTAEPEALVVPVTGFEDGDPLFVVNWPTDGSLAVEAVSDPKFEGSGSMKLPLEYKNKFTTITYMLEKATVYPDSDKLYVSFWMSSDVDCTAKLQLADIDWNGDEYYDLSIKAGTHMYNIDISGSAFRGFSRLLILQKGEYYAAAPKPFSGFGYMDSVVLTDTPRTLSGEDPVVSTSASVTETTKPAVVIMPITDFEEGELTPKEGPYMKKGKHFDLATSPVYSGKRSLKMTVNMEGDWTKTQWVMEPASYDNWFYLNDDTKYLSFWMNSDVDCVLRVILGDPDWGEGWYQLVNIKKGTHMYNVDISSYEKTVARGVEFQLNAEDYKSTKAWKGTIYLDSVVFSSEPRILDGEGGGQVNTGEAVRVIPAALLLTAGVSLLALRKKKK